MQRRASEQSGSITAASVIVARGTFIFGESLVSLVVREELVDAVQMLVEVVGRGGDGAGMH